MKFNLFLVIFISLGISVFGITTDHESSSSLNSNMVKDKELKGSETRDPRDPMPEFYRGTGTTLSTYDRERYGNLLNRPDRFGSASSSSSNTDKGNFVTSPGVSKFGSSTTYGNTYNRDRVGSGTSSYGGTSYSNNQTPYYGNSYGGPGSSSVGYGYMPPGMPGSSYDPTRQPPPSYGPPQPSDPSMFPGYNVYDVHVTDDNGYGYNQYGNGKDLTKKILIPLAGAAILGVAAALMANPVLLQLGAASGKRKRRDTSAAQELAYKGQDTQK